jgi:hypothetical protein
MTKKGIVYLILEALLFITILFSVVKCNNNKIDTLEHNITSYKNNIEYITLENNELLQSKQSLLLTEAELREELDITKNEIKSLNKSLDDKIAYISRLKSQLSFKDTIILKPDTVYMSGGVTTKKFIWTDDWTYLEGSVFGSDIKSSSLSIDEFRMNLDLDIGLTEDYKFWAKTSNPYITFNSINSGVIEGSSLNRKEKRFHHGVSIGFGINYGLINKSLDIGPSAIYGFTYTF